MSEQFRSLRHLTTHVDEQVRIFTQLQEAIGQVGSLLDQLPERKKELEAVEQQITSAKLKITHTEEAQHLLVETFRKQRQDTAELVKKEQQERVTARESWRLEVQEHHREMALARQTLADVQREIDKKRLDAATLEQELASTVKAVLRR